MSADDAVMFHKVWYTLALCGAAVVLALFVRNARQLFTIALILMFVTAMVPPGLLVQDARNFEFARKEPTGFMANTARKFIDSTGRGALDVPASALESLGIASVVSKGGGSADLDTSWLLHKGIELENFARAAFPVDVTSVEDTEVKVGYGFGVFLALAVFMGILAAVARGAAGMMGWREHST
jgi:hypothetical protein